MNPIDRLMRLFAAPEVTQLEAKVSEQEAGQRLAVRSELTQLDAALASAQQAFEVRRRDVQRDLDEALAAADRARASLDALNRGDGAALAAMTGRRDALRTAMRATAPPSLARFVDQLRAEAMRLPDALDEIVAGQNVEGQPIIAWSNATALQARQDAIFRLLREDFEHLYCTVMTEGDVEEAATEIRAALPALPARPDLDKLDATVQSVPSRVRRARALA